MIEEKYLEALGHIKKKGFVGINDAAMVVGYDAALGLFIANLDEPDGETLSVLKDHQATNFAHADLRGGRVVIYDQYDNLIGAFEAAGNGTTEDVPIEGLHVPMWMQGTNKLITLFPGRAPYEDLKKFVAQKVRESTNEFWRAHGREDLVKET